VGEEGKQAREGVGRGTVQESELLGCEVVVGRRVGRGGAARRREDQRREELSELSPDLPAERLVELRGLRGGENRLRVEAADVVEEFRGLT